MVETSDPLILKDSGDGKLWELQQPVTFVGSSGQKFTVPAGFVTDLASIPRIVSLIIPKSGKYNRAAVLHDYLWRVSKADYAGLLAYAEHGVINRDSPSEPPIERHMVVDPVDVDGLFRRAMRLADVGFVRRWVMWAAVRAAAILTGRTGDMKFSHWTQLAAVAGSTLLPLLAGSAFLAL